MKIVFRRLRFCLHIFIVSIFIAACGNTIQGTYTTNDAPNANAPISLRSVDSGKIEQEARTDASGQYAFRSVADGSYEIVVKFNLEGEKCELAQNAYVTGSDVTQDIEIPNPIDLSMFRIFNFGTSVNCE